MTRDDVIRLAKEAGFRILVEPEIEWIERLIEMAQTEEREACAKAFEAEADTWKAWPQAGAAKRKGSKAIRARGQA